MAWRQKYNPNVKVRAQRGWCLKYIDDAGKAPMRRPTARAAYVAEKNAKRISKNTPPTNIWVVGYLDLGGVYAAYDHVFFMKYKGKGKYEIRDSEVASGFRSPYTSINSILAWFGNYSPRYIGWSYITDGRKYAETYTPKPAKGKRIPKKGRATVIVAGLNVRNSPSLKGKVVATYARYQSFNYDSYIKADGITWLSYKSWTGSRRYVAQGVGKTKYVKGGV